eukprot:TRINITY_DN55599_c0_g1_i2.p1 TRINITY_DN55599_c0_g1~~TRINITY_DN55599_c0_g1_i2.p1  ORF type:complete len:165 (+),score=33.62 TRINITY_DN55599_c0_g1_i2:198-692(+)
MCIRDSLDIIMEISEEHAVSRLAAPPRTAACNTDTAPSCSILRRHQPPDKAAVSTKADLSRASWCALRFNIMFNTQALMAATDAANVTISLSSMSSEIQHPRKHGSTGCSGYLLENCPPKRRCKHPRPHSPPRSAPGHALHHTTDPASHAGGCLLYTSPSPRDS